MLALSPLFTIILFTLGISLLSFVFLLFLIVKKRYLKKYLMYVVAFAAGSMLGASFLHLLPEAVGEIGITNSALAVAVAVLFFYIFEKLLGWHHHHDADNDMHVLGITNLTADAVHNFLDGLIIAAAFMTDFNLGLVTAGAVILHELPQEIGDFGVLLHAGFPFKKALIANTLVALASVLGGVVGYYSLNSALSLIPYITAFAAGSFMYISISDLLPSLKKKWISYVIVLLGVAIFWVI